MDMFKHTISQHFVDIVPQRASGQPYPKPPRADVDATPNECSMLT